MKPNLIITIDTEEGFDWSKPFSRNGYITKTLFDHDFHMTGFYSAYNIKPVLLVSYPILNDNDCQRLLKKYMQEKRYLIGTHLHSWVTPPYDETLSNFNSFANNLPADLEYHKLKTLTDKFIDIFDQSPIYYKAGRYGIGQRSYSFLKKLGYRYDFSPFAKRDFSHIMGVDFSHIKNAPFYPLFPNKSIIAYPGTADYIGHCKNNLTLRKIFKHNMFTKFKGRAALAKLGLMNFIPLTPEGVSEYEMKTLTRVLLSEGQTYFHLSYHSSSFSLNGSPYSTTEKKIIDLQDRLKNYIHFFHEIGGETCITNASLNKL
jgi:hypothetical protein